MSDTKYQTTEAQCLAVINKNGCVCSGCGGELSPIETVNNSDEPTFWSGCEKCGRFDSGVPGVVFKIARRMVEEHRLIPYSHIQEPYNQPSEMEYWKITQTHGASPIVATVLRLKSELEEK